MLSISVSRNFGQSRNTMGKEFTKVTFSENLKSIRKNQELSQESLADLMGIQRAQVWRWENGNGNPRLDTLIKLSEILNVDVSELVQA